jgi:hypothetical protein
MWLEIGMVAVMWVCCLSKASLHTTTSSKIKSVDGQEIPTLHILHLTTSDGIARIASVHHNKASNRPKIH